MTIGGFRADERRGTGFVIDSDSGVVPDGTTDIDVTLTMTRTDGASNDGYADSLSLVFN